MQKIDGKTIYLTKGDTFKATISIKDANGDEYVPEAEDVIRFAMKTNYSDNWVLIEKVIPHDTMLLQLNPEDTKDLDVRKYVYDVQITFANGDVDTFIDRAVLVLTEEVN